MSMMGGGRIGYSNISKTIRLNDTAGVDIFQIIDADGVPVFKVDSTGVRHTRRGTQRIA